MSNYTYGLDLSLSSTGVVVFDEHGKAVYVRAIQYEKQHKPAGITPSGKSKCFTDRQRIERLLWIVGQLPLQSYPPSHVFIENYAFSKHSSSVTGLAELHGVVMTSLLEQCGVISKKLSVTQCRHFVVGDGKVSKDDTQRWLLKQGLKFATDDEGDAYVVGLTGFYISHPDTRQSLTQDKLEVIDAITRGAKRRKPAKRRTVEDLLKAAK